MKLRPMKLKALLLALAVAGTAAAFGLTDTGRSDTGTGTTATTTTTTTTGGSDCHRFWAVGTIGSIGTTSFSLTPRSRDASAPAAPAVTVGITPDTRVGWQGKGSLAGPAAGDVARVFGKQCGQTVTAWLVFVSPPRDAAQGKDGGKDGVKEGPQGPSEHRH